MSFVPPGRSSINNGDSAPSSNTTKSQLVRRRPAYSSSRASVGSAVGRTTQRRTGLNRYGTLGDIARAISANANCTIFLGLCQLCWAIDSGEMSGTRQLKKGDPMSWQPSLLLRVLTGKHGTVRITYLAGVIKGSGSADRTPGSDSPSSPWSESRWGKKGFCSWANRLTFPRTQSGKSRFRSSLQCSSCWSRALAAS